MGTFVKIELKTKTEKNINKLNQTLKTLGLDNAFMSEQDFKDWADDMKHNPDNFSVTELKQRFNWCAQVGVIMFDVAFSRTSQEDAEKYLKFISKYKNNIKSIEYASELIDRFELTDDQKELINSFVVEPPEPEKLPESEQYKPTIQGGQMLCKSYSPQPFWVVFGNVEKPTFMKEKIYVDDLYNNIYRDKKGYAYMLIPLMPINNSQFEFGEEVFDLAWNMGLREDPNYFLPMIYGFGIGNLSRVAESFKDFYTQDEIMERFEKELRHLNNTNPYNRVDGFVWKDNTKRFMYTSSDVVQNKCNVLTSLEHAIQDKNVVAEIMSKVLDTPFKAFEFKETIAVTRT